MTRERSAKLVAREEVHLLVAREGSSILWQRGRAPHLVARGSHGRGSPPPTSWHEGGVHPSVDLYLFRPLLEATWR